MNTQRYNRSVAYLAWGTAAFFFFYQYIIRIIPGIVGEDIKRDLFINAEQFGLIGSLYVYAYAFVQIPLGLMLDKFGIKRIIIASVSICIIGTLVMSAAVNVYWIYFARIIIGLGSGSAFLVSMKIVTDFLPEGKRGLLIGATLTIGTLSAIIFSRPVAVVSRYFGWLDTCFYIAMAGFVVLAASVLLIPNISTNKSERRSKGFIIRDLLSVIKNKYVVIYAIMSVGAYTPTTVLSDLWGPSFLKIKFHLDNTGAASINSTLFIGLAVGSLFIPWLFERIKKIDLGIALCSFVMCVSYLAVLYLDFSSMLLLIFCLFIIGFTCGSEMLCFTGVARYLKPENSGLAIGFVNTFNMLGGGLLQHLVGIIIDNKWDGKVDLSGLRVYTVSNYVESLSVVFFLIVLTFILAMFLRSRK